MGVLLAASVVTVGGAIFLVRHGRETPHYHAFVGEPEYVRSISKILGHAFSAARAQHHSTWTASAGGHSGGTRRLFHHGVRAAA